MTPSDIVRLKGAIDMAADFPDSSVAWWNAHLPAVKVLRLTIDLDRAIARAELADGCYISLLQPECALADFVLVTRLAAPTAQET